MSPPRQRRHDLDEDDVRVRPQRGKSRPRTKDRPEHSGATEGLVVAVDRGRYTCLLTDGDREITAMRARELGRKGIRANAICPGFIETPILSSIPDKVIKMMEDKVPMGRLGKPEEIANTYAWLASDEASYINGAVIEVSGGCTI